MTCDECGLKPWDADDLNPGDMVCVCDDINETDPGFIIGQYLPIATGGDYVPGSVDGNPLFVAVWLEYGRRGGVEPAQLAEYRKWLVSHAPVRQLEQVVRICALLEALTEAGDLDGLGAYLDALMSVTS